MERGTESIEEDGANGNTDKTTCVTIVLYCLSLIVNSAAYFMCIILRILSTLRQYDSQRVRMSTDFPTDMNNQIWLSQNDT